MVMDFAPDGFVHACCANAAHPLGNVRDQTLREIWDGERATALRAAMVRHDFGYGCGTCRQRLALGTGEADVAYYRRHPAPRDVRWPELMAFGLHNTCNAACVMCGGNLSSRLRALEGRPRLEPAYGERFFAELDEFLPHLRRAEFRGGEPFLVREHFRVWDKIIEQGLDLEVQVTTNGTVWNDQVERVLDALPVQVTLSMDGVTAGVNEAIRVGTDHAAVLVNLDRFCRYAADRGTRLDLSFCVLRENWHELADLVQLADQLGIEGHPQLVLDPAHGLHRLPTAELEAVRGALEEDGARLDLTLEVNRAAWTKVLGWLDAELRQRAGGHPLRLWEPPGPGIVAHVAATRALAPTPTADRRPPHSTDAARAALAAWAGRAGAEVAEMVTDPSGQVRSADLWAMVPVSAPPLPELVGRSFTDAFADLVTALGPHLWVVDEWVGDDVVEQTLLLSPSPLRDKAGLFVRLWSARTAEGAISTLLAAADRFATSSTALAVPVRVPGLRRPS